MQDARQPSLQATRLALFSIMIAMGGLPLYVHLPEFVSSELGISLASLGGILLALRAFDMIQDPFIGRLLDQNSGQLPLISIIAALLMAFGFLGLFYLRIPNQQIWVLTLSAALVFTGYSTLYILLYRTSSQMALPSAARIREISLLIGVIIGAILPFGLAAMGWDAYRAYGVLLFGIVLIAALFALPIWPQSTEKRTKLTIQKLREIGGTRILALMFLNTLPVAITSTLFLFFVSDRLALPDIWSGIFLAFFFIGTMLGVFIFGAFMKSYPPRGLLLTSMTGAILTFLWAYFLPEGAILRFSIISITSGIFLGAEIYILPVTFARLLEIHDLQIGAAFGIWSFLNKLGLASASAIILPLLAFMGYERSQGNPEALTALAFCYALLPSLIKLSAIFIVYRSPKEVF